MRCWARGPGDYGLSLKDACIPIGGMTSRFPKGRSACPEPGEELRRRPDTWGECRQPGNC
jgi:hypothetical protein